MSNKKLAMELILDELDQLGVDGIRDHFQELGLKGEQVDPYRCVTARYLSDQLGTQVFLTRDLIFFDKIEVSVPRNIRSFILAFDRGEFPELVEGVIKNV